MSFIKLLQTSPNTNSKNILVSAGFSKEAEQHVRKTFEPFDAQQSGLLDVKFNIIYVLYDPEVKRIQDDAVNRNNRPREYEFYKSLGCMIGDALVEQKIDNVHIIAKSAGAAVLSYLPLSIKVSSISLLAPAPILVDTFGVPCRSMPLLLGWAKGDKKIPYEPFHTVVLGFLSAHGYTVEELAIDAATHDFTPMFIERAISRVV